MSIINKRWLLDGDKTAVLHVYFESDGATGELENYALVDPTTDFAKPMGARAGLILNQAWFSSSEFDLKLSFEAVPNVPVWVLSTDTAYQDFRYFGGLKDKSWPDATGKLLISTLGFEPATAMGSLILEFRKG